MAATRNPIIDLDAVRLTLAAPAGPVNVLGGVSLRVAAGEAVGLMGPSGAGKSSLMMIIAGLERATSGRVTVAGQDLSRLDEDRLARFRRDHVGIVFQAFHLIPTMTARENVAIPLELAGKRDAGKQALAALDEVGLGQRAGHYPSQLSGGEQQRVALARAIAPNPDLILADEPTGNLDTGTGQRVIDLLFRLGAARGATLVLITHDRALAARCGRIVPMADGRLV
jgi:putative ABC transport system ATP-binding protein